MSHRPVARFRGGGGAKYISGAGFCFYCMLKINLYGHNKIFGALSPNLLPWLLICAEELVLFFALV